MGTGRKSRRQAVDFVRSNNRLEGLPVVPEAAALEERYIAGELSDQDFRTEMLALAVRIAGNPSWNPVANGRSY